MRFEETSIAGVWLANIDKIEDERGFFARAWCEREASGRGLTACVSQANISYNRRVGTLRGLHLQRAPHAEMKAVRCIKGSVYDVVVDLRPASATYLSWYSTQLSADNRAMVCVPEGCAHGFQTLEDDTEVFYLVSHPYSKAAENGVRWDDPLFNIAWPLRPASISKKDAAFLDFVP